MIQVVNFKFKIPNNTSEEEVVNTTSRSSNWSSGLSPFFCGPVELYDGYISKNVENAWQYSKVYNQLGHIDENNNPTRDYFEWAQKGWNSLRAERYPMGRGAIPEYSYWAGEKLDYVSARKKIYIPLYSGAVIKTNAFQKLKQIYENKSNNKILYLIDFDAHNLPPEMVDYDKLWYNPNIKMGHAYVLAMMLEGKL